MQARVKMRVMSVLDTGIPGQKRIRLEAIQDEAIAEDQKVSQATPLGFVEMNVDNPAALDTFKLSEHYFVVFIPAPVDVARGTGPQSHPEYRGVTGSGIPVK